MSGFISGVMKYIQTDNKMSGENGDVKLKTTSNLLVDLFDMLVRNETYGNILNKVEEMLKDSNNIKQTIINLIILTFQTRDCRGGKGEKQLFYNLLYILYKKYPAIILEVIEYVHIYGYFQDYWNFLCFYKEIESSSEKEWRKLDKLYEKIIDIYSTQLKKDKEELELSISENITPNLSFAGKWAPREKKSIDRKLKVVKKLTHKLGYKDISEYRKLIVKLNKTLKTTEVKMSARKWREIEFQNVTSKCLHLHLNSFLNEKELDDIDRQKCTENLIRFVNENPNKISGKVLYPSDITKKILNNSKLSETHIKIIQAQWDQIKNTIQTECYSKNTNHFIPIVDTSGSMYPEAINVSIGLGILLSEITNEYFRNKVLTFSSESEWFDLEPEHDIYRKIKSLKTAEWGMTTDLYKAMNNIGNIVLEEKLEQNEIPQLMIISDMEFDESGNSSNRWNTVYEDIKQLFNNIGMQIRNKPLDPPTIVFWNVRKSKGYIEDSQKDGVILLSGYSPSLMKYVLSGDLEKINEKNEKVKLNSIDILNKILNDERYNIVKNKVQSLENSLF